jgi:hypothetical protein
MNFDTDSYIVFCGSRTDPPLPSKRRRLRLRPPNRQHFRLHPQNRSPLANAARRRLPRHNTSLRLRQPSLQERPPNHAHALLSPRHSRLRDDLERHLERRRRHTVGRVYADRVFCAGDESDCEHGHGECGGKYEEEFYGEWDFCDVLCW